MSDDKCPGRLERHGLGCGELGGQSQTSLVYPWSCVQLMGREGGHLLSVIMSHRLISFRMLGLESSTPASKDCPARKRAESGWQSTGSWSVLFATGRPRPWQYLAILVSASNGRPAY